MTGIAEQAVVLTITPTFEWGKTMSISAEHLRKLGIEADGSMFVPRNQYWNLRSLSPKSLAQIAKAEMVKQN